jgi:SAM-dependent methyltransferase
VVLSSVAEMPECGRFDLAVAAGLLEFVDDPGAVFARCRSLVKPGGRLVILVPLAGPAGFLYRVFHERRSCPVHIRSAREYVDHAGRAGFRFRAARVCTPISRAMGFEFP